MTLEEAIKILGELYDPSTGGFHSGGSQYVSWKPGEDTACVDDDFTADQLEAMAVVMRAERRNESPNAAD